MDISSLKLALVIGVLCWGSWPLVAQASNLKDPIVRGFLISIVTTLGFVPFLSGRISLHTLTSDGALFLFVAGVLNFAGHYLFPRLQVTTGGQLSFYMPLILALCILVSAIGGLLFFGDTITWPKTFFTAWIMIGVIGLAFTALR